MTITFDIPGDVRTRVASIPDLGAWIERFLRHEPELETLRANRYGAEARAIAAKAVANANRVQLREEDRDASFAILRNQHQAVNRQLLDDFPVQSGIGHQRALGGCNPRRPKPQQELRFQGTHCAPFKTRVGPIFDIEKPVALGSLKTV